MRPQFCADFVAPQTIRHTAVSKGKARRAKSYAFCADAFASNSNLGMVFNSFGFGSSGKKSHDVNGLGASYAYEEYGRKWGVGGTSPPCSVSNLN